MFRNHKTFWIVAGASLILAIAIVTGAVVTTGIARAASGLGFDVFHRGPGGPGGPLGGDQDQYLADALGITVDELQAAREAANDAALDQAVANGDLTQAQADAIRTLRDMDNDGQADGRGGRFGGFGFHFGTKVDMDALLAAQLNISVDELQAAREQAKTAAIEAAVANGTLTQEQADLMKAREALEGTIDREALTAQVLGISTDELQAAREAGTTMDQLLQNAGLTQDEFRTAMQTAYEAAVKQAVEDGVITQAQADQILANGGSFGPGFGRGGHGGPGHDGFGPGPFAPNGDNPAPGTTPEVPAPTDSASTNGV